MITYLHHTDPQLPHFRKGEWSFQRGAACTVDRDFLGWQGRFFLHDVAHYHVVHHFFPQMPFCELHLTSLSGSLRICIFKIMEPRQLATCGRYLGNIMFIRICQFLSPYGKLIIFASL